MSFLASFFGAATAAAPQLENLYGYGRNHRCSTLQRQWQTQHPTFLAIKKHADVCTYLDSAYLARELAGDPALLQPPAVNTPWLARSTPQLIHYVQLPLYLWVPDFFYPHPVKKVPCPEQGCNEPTARLRWRSGGPRVVHDIHHVIYLHTCDYLCAKR